MREGPASGFIATAGAKAAAIIWNSLPIKKYWDGIRYFDLYGFVGMAYDAARDILRLSFYGDYYRAEENPLPKCNTKSN